MIADLFDACNEQLVLGRESVWTGDRMRREPTPRLLRRSYRPQLRKETCIGWASSSVRAHLGEGQSQLELGQHCEKARRNSEERALLAGPL